MHAQQRGFAVSGDRCAAPVPRDTLLAYWLGELDESAEVQLDEHLLGCSMCTGQLQSLVDLGQGICRLVQHGRLRSVVADALPKQLAEAGFRVREYQVPRNGSVHCTIAPDDDVVIARLQAPLADVRRLDLLFVYPEGQGQERVEQVPFNAAAGEVLVMPGNDMLRSLPSCTMRMQLFAADQDTDRLIGEYTFHHTPWKESPRK
jgi:hypothetical protein